MRLFTLLLITLYCVGLTGCSTAKVVSDADLNGVRQCLFLASVTGSSPFGGLMADYGTRAAKALARSEAARLGATHIVWYAVTSGTGSTVGGHAYRCK